MHREPPVSLEPSIVRSLSAFVGQQGHDFSGADIRHVTIKGQTFFESIFNGCLLDHVHAAQSVFQHTEFTEARLSHCSFEDTSFDHSDFVLSHAQDCDFVRCSFQNAEWRDATFERVHFRQCVFRNTTSSLVRFTDCEFDDASALSFQGASKRYSLFVRTHLALPSGNVDFLKTNFGLLSASEFQRAEQPIGDPLYQMAVMYYRSALAPNHFVPLVLSGLEEIIQTHGAPQRLRLRYLAEICKLYLDEGSLSILGSRLLERSLSERSAGLTDRGQALDLLSLLLAIRLSLHTRIEAVSAEEASLPATKYANLDLQFAFESTLDRAAIEDYLQQLSLFCSLKQEQVAVRTFRRGSTFVDAFIIGAVHLAEVFRFVKYSLSAATVAVEAGGKLKKALRDLSRDQRPTVTPTAVNYRSLVTSSPTVNRRLSASVLDDALGQTDPIDVIVDAMNDRVLVVGGRVRVTIALS
jgi:hypothetical protein